MEHLSQTLNARLVLMEGKMRFLEHKMDSVTYHQPAVIKALSSSSSSSADDNINNLSLSVLNNSNLVNNYNNNTPLTPTYRISVSPSKNKKPNSIKKSVQKTPQTNKNSNFEENTKNSARKLLKKCFPPNLITPGVNGVGSEKRVMGSKLNASGYDEWRTNMAPGTPVV